MFEKSKELVSANSWAVWNWVYFLIKTPPSPNSDYRTDRGLQQYENEWNKRLEKEEKTTTLVAMVGIAVEITKDAREWYKATKKRKTTKPDT